MRRPREIAKFFCGFEAFHALVHAYLWGVMGIQFDAAWNLFGLFFNAAIAVVLGVWAWRNH